MKNVSFSLGLFPTESPRRIVELAKLAEDLGYSTVYIGDSQMIWREAHVILGAAAVATSRILLAPGVTNPVTRDPAVIAAACATLDELTSGRGLLGIGTGDSALETVGKRPAKLAYLEQSIGAIRALLAGEPTIHPDSKAPARLTYARAGGHTPVYLAVSGPKIHRLAGRIGDGAIVLAGIDPGLLAASRRELQAGAAETGRDLEADGFKVVCWTPCSIQDDGRAAHKAVKAHVARILKRDLPFALDSETMDAVHIIREQYEYYEHMVVGTEHGVPVPDNLVEKFAVAGTLAEAREQIERLAATGLVDEIAIIPHTAEPVERERIIRQVGAMMREDGTGVEVC
jgi:5,10-methylenetetrahydromethanopterin reductase